MRFTRDETRPVEVAPWFRQAGHEATTDLDHDLGGRDDRTVATVCQQEGRAFVTLALDLAEIRTYPPAHDAGMVVRRLPCQDQPPVLEGCARVMPLLSQAPLAQRLWIVEATRLRMREEVVCASLVRLEGVLGLTRPWSGLATSERLFPAAHR